MMPRDTKHNLIATAVVVLGLTMAVFASSFIEKHRPELPPGFEDNDLALQGKRLRGFTLGADGLVADWYWMVSLQYIGDKLVKSEKGLENIEDLRPLNPRLLYPYLDNATDLDPKFLTAYSYGAIVLPAIDPAQSIALTEKGIANNPGQWRLYQYLGYIYWRLNDYEKAGQVYDKGSTIPGAPVFMKMMSAAMRTKGNSRETARSIYTQMLDESADQQSRESAQLRLYELDSMDERDTIALALENFKMRNGRCPVNLIEAMPYLKNVEPVNGRHLRLNATGNLVDPTGTPYMLDVRECRTVLSPDSRIPKS